MFRNTEAAQPGDLAKDVVTGFEGIITARTTWLHGCDRIAIQPTKLGSDGTPVKDQVFDEDRVKIIKKAKVKFTPPTDDELVAMPIGAEAKDTVTGFKGIIAALTVTLGGQLHVVIEPEKLNKDGGCFDNEAFVSSRIEVIKPKPVPKTTAQTTGKDGGPQRGEGARVHR